METSYPHETALFGRLAFDFDNPNALWDAITGGLRFAQRVKESYDAKVLVVESGFKEARVYVFLSSPRLWSVVKKLWNYLMLHTLVHTGRMIDKNMNQWNRICKIPLTYNLKKDVRKLTKIVYPEEIVTTPASRRVL